MAPYYPIFLDLQGKPVLVAGAGKVALRKTTGLLEAGARVTVVAPRAEPEFAQLPVTFAPPPVPRIRSPAAPCWCSPLPTIAA